MSFFIDSKTRKRKSPVALYSFFMALAFFCIFGVIYWKWIDFLSANVYTSNTVTTALLQSLLVSAAGTAVCCLGFLLPDKRLVPGGFTGLAVLLGMFCAGISLLDADARGMMLQVTAAFGLCPVLVGNAVVWPLYLLVFRRRCAGARADDLPAAAAALRASAAQAAREQRAAPQSAAGPAAKPSAPRPAAAEKAAYTEEEALFGPEASASPPPAGRPTAQDEAALFYDDEDPGPSDPRQ
jgi:hypothetical protein